MKRFDLETYTEIDELSNGFRDIPQMVDRKYGEYILYDDFVKALAMIYNMVGFVTMEICFNLDKSGALLDEVRDAAEKLRKGEL